MRAGRSWCAATRFKAPKSVTFGQLPKTSTGKIRKYLLREEAWAGTGRRIG
ncbi:hypothetical protein [Amycolatopsis magusensis]|uniref:hypothetical protein n=1 Tax=Amycolatopsis magusensis TaxID=882444 RepID=UPI0024A9384A|nr:hypothetical protein [Amycolatopsis magusensis]MDI5976755.1 hypothetical protein [Amycolatopsis magusensis]